MKIKNSIDQLTHTIGTLGAIRVPNEENRDLLVNAAVVNRLASEATTDIVLDEGQNIRRTSPTDIDLSQIVNNNAPITIPDEKIIREITPSSNTLELQLKDFLIMELSIIKGNIDIAASEKPDIVRDLKQKFTNSCKSIIDIEKILSKQPRHQLLPLLLQHLTGIAKQDITMENKIVTINHCLAILNERLFINATILPLKMSHHVIDNYDVVDLF
jgi:hypothetical protein